MGQGDEAKADDQEEEVNVNLVDITADDPRLAEFHRGIYWDAFAKQHEPLATWQRALRGDDAYRLTVRLAVDGDELAGGIAFELYPRSRCGLVTYMVVAPPARRTGLGKRMQREAAAQLFGDGALAVFGEINDPRTTTIEHADAAWARLERNQRWGARVVDARYIQPALGPGLVRDRELVLIALAGATPLPADMPGAIVRDFVDELYAVTEGGAADPEIQIGERVRLVEMQR
jgi:GNAT superfamily N-acetyltransferase